MKLGLFTPVLNHLDVDAMIAKVRSLDRISAVELGTGGWPGAAHLDLDSLEEPCKARDYKKRLTDAGLSISALSCHANPLPPEGATAAAADALFQRTVLLAERLEVPVVVTFSGCPGDADAAKHPNWIT